MYRKAYFGTNYWKEERRGQYLNKTVSEMRQEIFRIYHEYVEGRSEEDDIRAVRKLEKLLRRYLTDSFRNGVHTERSRS